MVVKVHVVYVALGLIAYSAIMPVRCIGVPLILEDNNVPFLSGEVNEMFNITDLTKQDYADLYPSIPPMDIDDRGYRSVSEGNIYINN